MIDASARPARSLKQAISRRLPKRRDDSGLTTLEWLLIVAAVAGLAALAVVLVTNVVNQTGEQIAGQSARLTSAKLAAATIEERLLADATAAATADLDTQAEGTAFAADALRSCKRLEITYSDLRDVSTVWDWDGATTGVGMAPDAKADWVASLLDGVDEGCVITATT